MEVAENKAVMQGDYVESNFDFYNAKNLTNSEDLENRNKEKPLMAQAIRYKPSFVAKEKKFSNDPERYRNMVQPEESISYQQDQNSENEEIQVEDASAAGEEDTVEVNCIISCSNFYL